MTSTKFNVKQINAIDTIGEIPEESTAAISVAYLKNIRITGIFGNRMLCFLTDEKTKGSTDELVRNDRVRLKDSNSLGTIDEVSPYTGTMEEEELPYFIQWDDGLFSRELAKDIEPSSNKMAWKLWKTSAVVNLGESLRFRVNGSKHRGYVTIKYLSNLEPKPDSPGNQFEVEFAVLNGTEYKVVDRNPVVHRDDIIRVISQKIGPPLE